MWSCRTVWRETRQLIQHGELHLPPQCRGKWGKCVWGRLIGSWKIDFWFWNSIGGKELNFEFILISLLSGLLKMKKHLSLVSSSDLTPNSLLLFCCEKGIQRQASALKASKLQKTECHFSFRSHSGLKSHYVKSCCLKSISCSLSTLAVRFLSCYPTSVSVSSRASVPDLFIES